MADKSGRIEWFIHDGQREIGPLTEIELRKRLKRGRRDKLRVRQNDGNWHPAKVVVRKFRELAANGIYIKLGTVAGPYTAEKAFALLDKLNLEGVKAKIGLHGSWVPAERLLQKLQMAIDQATTSGGKVQDTNNPPLPEESDDTAALQPLDEDDDVELFPTSSDLSDAHSLTIDDSDELIPVVEPIDEADDDIPTVQPIEPIPVVEPIQPTSLVRSATPAHRPLVHHCHCGREVRVMPQHVGMTMQCPVCKRTFVAGRR